MIILSVGMPRAGSGWHYNLVQDLMRTTHCDEAADIRARFHLSGILTEMNCNIGVLSARRLAMVAVPSLLGKTFVIKAHSKPTRWSRLLTHWGALRITYIYRDPRDALLSAMDYGKRTLDNGRPNAFSHLSDLTRGMAFMDGYVEIWRKWMQQRGVLTQRYEDLLSNYDVEVARLVVYLGLDASAADVRKAVVKNQPERAHDGQRTHFFKGKIGRFRQAFTAAEQELLLQRYGSVLPQMGYEP